MSDESPITPNDLKRIADDMAVAVIERARVPWTSMRFELPMVSADAAVLFGMLTEHPNYEFEALMGLHRGVRAQDALRKEQGALALHWPSSPELLSLRMTAREADGCHFIDVLLERIRRDFGIHPEG